MGSSMIMLVCVFRPVAQALSHRTGGGVESGRPAGAITARQRPFPLAAARLKPFFSRRPPRCNRSPGWPQSRRATRRRAQASAQAGRSGGNGLVGPAAALVTTRRRRPFQCRAGPRARRKRSLASGQVSSAQHTPQPLQGAPASGLRGAARCRWMICSCMDINEPFCRPRFKTMRVNPERRLPR